MQKAYSRQTAPGSQGKIPDFQTMGHPDKTRFYLTALTKGFQ